MVFGWRPWRPCGLPEVKVDARSLSDAIQHDGVVLPVGDVPAVPVAAHQGLAPRVIAAAALPHPVHLQQELRALRKQKRRVGVVVKVLVVGVVGVVAVVSGCGGGGCVTVKAGARGRRSMAWRRDASSR